MSSTLENRMANAIRALAIDAVQKANSGHPGAPMGMAEMSVALWHHHLKHHPQHPDWWNRDRFVLSNGHASMLIYALLHLSGYDLSLEEIQNFRQLHSKTPGHPEVGITPGVETTTGPLGQGFANAVGMALAEALLAQEFNDAQHTLIDHYTYAFVGDGCLMEGISHEVASLAGTLKLHKLIALYDDNGISIDGQVSHWFADNTQQRFAAYGWNVIAVADGHDIQAVSQAIAQAKKQNHAPTLILCKTHIGQGSPNMVDSEKVHGAPLGDAEIAATRQKIGWEHPAFHIPTEIYQAWNAAEKGQTVFQNWQEQWQSYQKNAPQKAQELARRMRGDLPADFTATCEQLLSSVVAKKETIATRKASQNSITALVEVLPELLGGSADLTGSNFTDWKGAAAVRAAENGIQFGRHINYGVREFGMSAMMNGMALHGGYIPFGGTFLTFADYSRNAIRMSALMKQRVIYVFTHDSIGLGEDGPTHQSVEHASSLRLIPNLQVWRPCDTVETMVAWQASVLRPQSVGMKVENGGPSALLLSRQNLPFVERTPATIQNITKGGYVLSPATQPQAVIIATGSEVQLALEAQKILAEQKIAVQVVSMPCAERFLQQAQAYQAEVLPKGLPRVAVEAGVTSYWRQFVGLEGKVVGIDTYGESAPAAALFKHFGLTTTAVVEAVQSILSL